MLVSILNVILTVNAAIIVSFSIKQKVKKYCKIQNQVDMFCYSIWNVTFTVKAAINVSFKIIQKGKNTKSGNLKYLPSLPLNFLNH